MSDLGKWGKDLLDKWMQRSEADVVGGVSSDITCASCGEAEMVRTKDGLECPQCGACEPLR